MSNTPSINRVQVLEWLKGGGFLAVTVTGVLLYSFLSVPATVFYMRLGTSPAEVGITYASLLSGSTVEILAVLVLLTIAVLLTSFVIAFGGLTIRFNVIDYQGTRHLDVPTWMFTDEEFEDELKLRMDSYRRIPDLMKVQQILNPKWPKSYAEIEAIMRRWRELQRLGVRTAEESSELDCLESQMKIEDSKSSLLPWLITKLWIQRWGRLLAISFILVTVTILLPMLAYVQAGAVLDGKMYFGNKVGAFDYHAYLVKVYPISLEPAPSIQTLKGKKFFLLGQNAQYAILYSPETHSTIRIPITAVITSSVR